MHFSGQQQASRSVLALMQILYAQLSQPAQDQAARQAVVIHNQNSGFGKVHLV